MKGLSSTEALQGLELDAGDRRSLLGPTALWLMEQRARGIARDDLWKQLTGGAVPGAAEGRTPGGRRGFYRAAQRAQWLARRAGAGHLTFQEHLAVRGPLAGGGLPEHAGQAHGLKLRSSGDSPSAGNAQASAAAAAAAAAPASPGGFTPPM